MRAMCATGTTVGYTLLPPSQQASKVWGKGKEEREREARGKTWRPRRGLVAGREPRDQVDGAEHWENKKTLAV